ncbi:MAG: Helix-TurN-helix protein [Parcubacteria group bacterium Gr01-1014_18]|nr:MAG: Helix-TurN-helix protein [Parcubacteria group bacterium Greene0416_36]TSC81190.1 MAG: Helix-TurN-helix protein [Parcubacteria group bacterium Gr01-1014_18]TSC99187.1 MAG: Helix-TurN-helix protein [Parcubacteria group bacterium Greene1014_20]TSD07455.1 MAG: Helix-TurN-helix protein [Parcubacteria group bacterium Greene0714_2]
MNNKYTQSVRAFRVARGFSQAFIAEKLGISRSSYIGIEQGKRELTMGEFEKLSSILGVSFEELGGGESPNYEKYKQMILAFLRGGDKIPKTKLAKLVYLADAGWFYYHLHSMSGVQYRKIQYGPVADPYFRVIDELYENGQIGINQTKEGAMLISQTRAGSKKDLSEMKREELELIKNIEKKWKGKKTKEIVEFTHNQLPYLCADDNDIISLGLITQEDPHEYY